MQMEFYLSFASILENEYYWWYEYIPLKKEYTSILEKIIKIFYVQSKINSLEINANFIKSKFLFNTNEILELNLNYIIMKLKVKSNYNLACIESQ